MLLGGCGSKQTGVATDDHTIHEDEAEEVLASYTTDDYIEFSHEDKCIRMYMVRISQLCIWNKFILNIQNITYNFLNHLKQTHPYVSWMVVIKFFAYLTI